MLVGEYFGGRAAIARGSFPAKIIPELVQAFWVGQSSGFDQNKIIIIMIIIIIIIKALSLEIGGPIP